MRSSNGNHLTSVSARTQSSRPPPFKTSRKRTGPVGTVLRRRSLAPRIHRVILFRKAFSVPILYSWTWTSWKPNRPGPLRCHRRRLRTTRLKLKECIRGVCCTPTTVVTANSHSCSSPCTWSNPVRISRVRIDIFLLYLFHFKIIWIC